MTPLQKYQQDLNLGGITADPLQAQIIDELQQLYEDFMSHERARKNLWTRSMKILGLRNENPVRGVYLWGGVGIGKTYLMDTFYNCLPTIHKQRMHFHRFMQMIHSELKKKQGTENPLIAVAKELSLQTRIICFDEFFVQDIADAMLLANLFKALFAQGVTLVATSNVAPDELYKNGLQRGLFLPAIALIKQYTRVIHLESDRDYRLRNLDAAGVYFYPLDMETAEKMRDSFESFARGQGEMKALIHIDDRPIETIRVAGGVAWFEFKDICSSPRSQMDYIEIAKSYPVVLVSNISKILPNEESRVAYFINLVDVFYDAAVKLIWSCEVPIEALYTEGRYTFEFRRTLSRLEEMQSKAYLS